MRTVMELVIGGALAWGAFLVLVVFIGLAAALSGK